MTEADPAVPPEPDGPEVPPAAPEVLPVQPSPGELRVRALSWLTLLGFLVLVAAIALAWLNPRHRPRSDQAQLAALNAQVEQLANRLADDETKLLSLSATDRQLAAAGKALAARPAPPDLGPIEARLAALEKRGPVQAAPPGADELANSLAPLTARIDKLEKALADLTPLSASVENLQKSVAELGSRMGQIERTASVAAAWAALQQGRPLGHLPGAPPALARFAATAPPTLSGLRLSFPAAASAERAAARPSEAGRSLGQRMKDRLGQLFTLQEGNKMIVGNAADPALATAQEALDAGNLQAAVAALQPLPSPLAPEMQHWKDQAEALLAAQSALAHFAGAG